MKRWYKVLLSVVVLALAVSMLTACNDDAVYDKELVKNGKFEDVIGGTLADWFSHKDADKSVDGKYNISHHPEDADKTYGETFLKLENKSSGGNYSYIYQEIPVVKNGIYKISAVLRNESLSQGGSADYTGAGLKIIEGSVMLAASKEIGDWTEYTVYVKPKNTDVVTVALSLGNVDADGVKSYAVGVAEFESVSMKRVESVPDGAEVRNVYKAKEVIYELSSTQGILFIVLLAVITVLIIVGAYFLYKKLSRDGGKNAFFNNPVLTVILITAAGVGLRLILAATLFAKGGTAYLASLAADFKNIGYSAIYDKYSGYMPLPMFQLWTAGYLIEHISSMAGQSIILRLTAIISEGVTIAVLYLFSRKYTTEKLAATIASLYAVLPVAFTLSAGYDVVSSTLVMLLLVTFVCIIEKKNIWLLITSFVGCMWSPIMVYVLPFVVLYEVMAIIKAENKKKLIVTFAVGWTLSFVAFLMVTSISVKEYFYSGSIFHIIWRYGVTMFKSQNCVSNAFNLYGLFNLNNKPVNTTAFWLNLLFCLILLVYSVSLYFKNRNRGELMLIAGFFITAMAVFSLNMTETALFAGLTLLLCYIAISGEERLFWVFGWFALLSFVNVAVVLNMTGVLGNAMERIYFEKNSVVYAFGNVLAALTTLYDGYVVYDVTTNGKRVNMLPLKAKEK